MTTHTAEHAKLSPSSSKRWFACPGSTVMEGLYPARTSQASDEGTACHAVAAWCLTEHWRANKRIGEYIPVSTEHDAEPRWVQFTPEMADMVQEEVDRVRLITIGYSLLMVEERVNFSHIVGQPNQFGTLDVGAVVDRELQIHDFKFGHTPVEAEKNTQLLIYALALYDEVSLAYDIDNVRLLIHQPKYKPTEWSCSPGYLEQFRATLRSHAISVFNAEQEYGRLSLPIWQHTFLNQNPDDEKCQFCRAMGSCPTYARKVQEVVGADFQEIAEVDDVAELAKAQNITLTAKMQAVPAIEAWCKAVRAEMERRLLAGEEDEVFGLELGRQGPRKWADPETARDLLRFKFRLNLEETHDMSLKNPTQIEKLTLPQKDEETGEPKPPILSLGRWNKQLMPLITRSEPKPSVKPKSAIKKPYVPTQPDAGDFRQVPEEQDDLAS